MLMYIQLFFSHVHRYTRNIDSILDYQLGTRIEVSIHNLIQGSFLVRNRVH